MTKSKPNDQLQKRGRKSAFRPEYILIAKACARFGAIEDEIVNELNIGAATLDRWKQKMSGISMRPKGRKRYPLPLSVTLASKAAISARSAAMTSGAPRPVQHGG